MIRYAVINEADRLIAKYGDCHPEDLDRQAEPGQFAISINTDGWISDETHVYDPVTNDLKQRTA